MKLDCKDIWMDVPKERSSLFLNEFFEWPRQNTLRRNSIQLDFAADNHPVSLTGMQIKLQQKTKQ